MQRKKKTPFILPDEMLLEVFSFLSPKDRTRAGEVCTKWRALSQDRMFAADKEYIEERKKNIKKKSFVNAAAAILSKQENVRLHIVLFGDNFHTKNEILNLPTRNSLLSRDQSFSLIREIQYKQYNISLFNLEPLDRPIKIHSQFLENIKPDCVICILCPGQSKNNLPFEKLVEACNNYPVIVLALNKKVDNAITINVEENDCRLFEKLIEKIFSTIQTEYDSRINPKKSSKHCTIS